LKKVLDHCVSSTVRDASDLGYSCFLVTDATVSFDRVGPDGSCVKADDIHTQALASLHQEFASIIDTSSLSSQLRDGDSGLSK